MSNARLNPQGLARKDKALLSAVLPPPGHVFASCDLSSGEPTCTAHYSQDKAYYDATFGMVGIPPYYAKDVLKIDNLYLTVMSVSPMGAQVMKDVFNARYGDESFQSRWRWNKEYAGEPFQDWVKKQIKQQYALHKIAALGMSYSMGPKKLQQAAYDAGHVISLQQTRDLYSTYWDLFGGVRAFAKRLEKVVKEKGYLVNDFGYRLVPDAQYKAFNYFIQSSVSGIMHVLCQRFFEAAPFCEYVLVIHDEVVFSCPKERVEEARKAMAGSAEALNNMLGWRVKVRVGFTTGENLYDAK